MNESCVEQMRWTNDRTFASVASSIVGSSFRSRCVSCLSTCAVFTAGAVRVISVAQPGQQQPRRRSSEGATSSGAAASSSSAAPKPPSGMRAIVGPLDSAVVR